MDSPSIYCVDQELVESAEPVVRQLQERKLSVILAESCTGGLLAAVLSHVPGADEVLHGAFVTYSKALKLVALDLGSDLLRDRGSVNEEVTLGMAQGALSHSTADIALAINGVLGPDADEDGVPAGLIYIATASITGVQRVEAYTLRGFHHDQVRREAVEQSLKSLERALTELATVPLVSPPPMSDQLSRLERISA